MPRAHNNTAPRLSRGAILLLTLFLYAPGLSARGIQQAPPENPPQTPEDQPPTPEIQSTWETAMNGDTITVQGRVRLVGSMPFADIIITDQHNNDWHLDTQGQNLLKNRQQSTITIRGQVERHRVQFADGRTLPDRRVLTNIQIIE